MEKRFLKKEDADKLFAQEAFMFSETGAEGVPLYRAEELFGNIAVSYVNNRKVTYLGKTINAVGEGSTSVWYLYKSGFYAVVAMYNHLLCVEAQSRVQSLRAL